jgi:two-component system, cell cycle sensor histidine kinase and response regulator CckA
MGFGSMPTLPNLRSARREPASEAVLIAGGDGFIVESNRAAEELFGYSADSLLGMNVMDLVPRRTWSSLPERRAIGTGSVLQLMARRGDGSEFSADVSIVVTPSGEGLRFAAIVRDRAASGSGECEQPLLDAPGCAHSLLEHSAYALLLADASGIVRYASPSARTMLNGGAKLVGSSVTAFVLPEQQEWMASVFRAATMREGSNTQTFKVSREDGATQWVEVTLSNRLADPSLRSVILTYNDITDRVEALDRLWQQEEQYRAIVEAVTESILILELDGRIVAGNPAVYEMYGYEVAQLRGRELAALIDASDRSRVAMLVERAAAGEPFQAEATGLHREGREVHVAMNGRSFFMGGIPHLLVLMSNVSDRKRLQQRLERVDRISSLGRLAATIAHEMNNVMMGIVPFAEIIRRRTENDPTIQNATTHILASAARGKGVTHDILRFTRATGAVELKAVEGTALLSQLKGEMENQMPPQIVLDLKCEDGLLLLGDASQLQQVLVNLLNNARDAMRSGGRITVCLTTCSPEAFEFFAGTNESPENFVHLSVADEGDGIPPYLLSHIFEPLFTTKETGGSGLGLAIVHQIVAAHDGQIHVANNPRGGSTFHLLLRKVEPEDSPSIKESIPHDVWKRIRSVLLVEDEPSVGEALVALLELEGVRCEWVTSGHAALVSLRDDLPDLLILDVGLPDISGVDLYREVARTHPRLPTIFSTGHGDHRLLDELDPSAPVGFLSKPYGMDLLTSRVRALFDRRQVGS